MSQQSNTTGRNTRCSAEHPSSSCSLSASPWNPHEGSSPGWLLQSPIRGLPSRGKHFPFPPCYQTACSQKVKTICDMELLALPLFCRTPWKPVLSHHPASLCIPHDPNLQGNQQREAEMVSIPRVSPQILVGIWLCSPVWQCPWAAQGWLKATKELGGECRTQYELLTTEKGGVNTHMKADEADWNHYEMAVSAPLFLNKERCRSEAGAGSQGC